MSSFGLVIPGRPVDTNFQQVDHNKFLITIPNAEAINHVVVFLTGLIQLPSDVAGCIFFSLPDPNAAPSWHYLGYISNDKPSAIYRLTNLAQKQANGFNQANGSQAFTNGLAFNYVQTPVVHFAQIGISVEPLGQVQQMVPAIETTASKASSFNEFIDKTVSNLYNYCSSFSRSLQELITVSNNNVISDARLAGDTQFVPLKTLQEWYENYCRRLSNDRNFWKTLN